MEIEIWSDVACPWCYIGKRRFEAALAQFEHRDDVRVTWRAFELDPDAPHETLLVLDATVGRNALAQENIFGNQIGVSGIVMTKLDGTARGGVLVPVAQASDSPIKLIGVGEGPMTVLAELDGDKLKAWDIKTDGVGLVDNYREQFNKIVEKDGFDGLIAKMKKKQAS